MSSFNIRLHKILAQDAAVLNAFPCSEHAKNAELILKDDITFRTLGVAWEVEIDCFSIRLNLPDRPYTKRGILAVINSVFDPLGIVSPVVLGGRLIQRAILSNESSDSPSNITDWDDLLPDLYYKSWETWLRSLQKLDSLRVERSFVPRHFVGTVQQSLHIFCDASKEVIGYVIYVRSCDEVGAVHVTFVVGDSKLAPRGAASIPRLELCAAVEAVLSVQRVQEELDTKPHAVHYYTDSKVVLGYISNVRKRFTVYVTRRVGIIRHATEHDQWHYVSSENNPADIATRPVGAQVLKASDWVSGPEFLRKELIHCFKSQDITISPDELPEVETESQVLLTKVSHSSAVLFGEIFMKISKWKRLVRIAMRVVSFVRLLRDRVRLAHGIDVPTWTNENVTEDAVKHLIREAQQVCFVHSTGKKYGKRISSVFDALTPIIDRDNIIRVGGRLKNSEYGLFVKHPILLPSNHPISGLILRHYHETIRHQGRHVTHGAIRDAGYHLENGRRAVRELLKTCVACRRLRAPCEQQLMADLPRDRTEAAPPFTNTGLDVLGPWLVSMSRHTRSRKGTQKVWAVIFCCQASRAIHVEVLSSLDTVTFRNALRRFFALRGSCKIIRSDRGTNFVGLVNEDINLENLSQGVKDLTCQWIFNPPHAPHFGGAWERKVGQVKRALDVAILQAGLKLLSLDELTTLLQEAAAIVNATPLWELSSDANEPQPLSPAMLLTMKSTLPEEQCYDNDGAAYGRRRWRRVQHLADEFWTRWRKEYLQELQTRQKWIMKTRSLSIGDIVLVRDRSAKRNSWQVAIIIKIKNSVDGLVRSATVKVAKSTFQGSISHFIYERPISELVLLQAV